MGTFLTIFVPHTCGNNTCTIMENMNSGNPYRSSVLVINTVSFGVFLMMYYSEIKRENWCISYLDINPQKPIEHLDNEIENYPKIKKRMSELNTQYKKLTILCAGVQVVNITVSVVDVAKFGAGTSAFLTMASYVVLIATKLSTTYGAASNSLSKERAYSAYLSGPKTYNVIDMDHKNDNEVPDDEAPEPDTVCEIADDGEVGEVGEVGEDTENIKVIMD